MSDPLRTEPPLQPEGASELDRDAKIEHLLLAGLDHYFGGQYEDAINVWTRVLFLDRSHARARAYIARARSAQAERQRESEELLHHGAAALGRGESQEAPRLLETAVGLGASPDEALGVIDRLSRLDLDRRPSLPVPGRPAPTFGARAAAPVAPRRVGGARLSIGLALIAALGMTIALLRVDWRAWLPFEGDTPGTWPAPHVEAPPMPLPLRGDSALEHAQALAAGGHLHDALAALEDVRPTDPRKADADRLRADLQRQLIVLAGEPSDLRGPGRGGRP